MSFYYVERDGKPVPATLFEWDAYTNVYEQRLIRQDVRPSCWVATIFDGQDPYSGNEEGPHRVYETTAFAPGTWEALEQERAYTREEAFENHDRFLAKLSGQRDDVVSFIDLRLKAMLKRPLMWGGNLMVEVAVLNLLEVRTAALGRADLEVNRRWVRFLEKEIPGGTNEPLADRLEKLGLSDKFVGMVTQFIERETAGRFTK